MSRWEKALLGVPASDIPALVPGILLAFAMALAGRWLASLIGTELLGFDKSPVSNVTLSILLGLILRNTVGVPIVFQPGTTFCVKKLLRLGIILLGIRLSLLDILRISASALPLVVIVVFLALLLVWQFAKRLGLPERLGLLTAVGTSICGVSAIVSAAPCIDASDEEVSYAVANITLFGLLAMFVYPFLAHALFSRNPIMAGMFLGTSIHDTAQATAGGLIYDAQYPGLSPTAGEVAVITKLVRNALMALIIPLVSWLYTSRICTDPQRLGKRKSILTYLPAFVLGFVALSLVRTIGDATVEGGRALGLWTAGTWSTVTGAIADWAKSLLAMAMASVGLGTSYQVLKGLGLRPFLLGLIAAALVGILSGILITIFVPLLGL